MEARGLGVLYLPSSILYLQIGVEQITQIQAQVGGEQFGTVIDMAAKLALGSIQLEPHVEILRPLARKQKRDWTRAGIPDACKNAPGVLRLQRIHCIFEVTADG